MVIKENTESKILNLLLKKGPLTTQSLAAQLTISRNTATKYLSILSARKQVSFREIGPSKVWSILPTDELVVRQTEKGAEYLAEISEKLDTIGGSFGIIVDKFNQLDHTLNSLDQDVSTLTGMREELKQLDETLKTIPLRIAQELKQPLEVEEERRRLRAREEIPIPQEELKVTPLLEIPRTIRRGLHMKSFTKEQVEEMLKHLSSELSKEEKTG